MACVRIILWLSLGIPAWGFEFCFISQMKIVQCGKVKLYNLWESQSLLLYLSSFMKSTGAPRRACITNLKCLFGSVGILTHCWKEKLCQFVNVMQCVVSLRRFVLSLLFMRLICYVRDPSHTSKSLQGGPFLLELLRF